MYTLCTGKCTQRLNVHCMYTLYLNTLYGILLVLNKTFFGRVKVTRHSNYSPVQLTVQFNPMIKVPWLILVFTLKVQFVLE